MAALGVSAAVMTLGFLAVGWAPIFPLALGGMAIVGAADGVWMVAHENLVQTVTPDAIRSRVFAGSEAVYSAGISIGLVAAGGLVSAVGAASTFTIGAGGALLASLLLIGSSVSAARVTPLTPRADVGLP